MGTGVLTQRQSSRGVKLNTHLHLVPWLGMSGDIHLLPLYALMPSAGKIFQLTQWNKVLLAYLLVSQFVVKCLTLRSSKCSIGLSSGVYWARWIRFKPSLTWRFALISYCNVRPCVCTYLKGPLIRICPQGTDEVRVTVSGHHGCGFRSLSSSLWHQLTTSHFTFLHTAPYRLDAQSITLFIFNFFSKNLKELTYSTFTKSCRYSCRYAIIFSSPPEMVYRPAVLHLRPVAVHVCMLISVCKTEISA